MQRESPLVLLRDSQIGRGTVSGHEPPGGKHANIIKESVNGTDIAPQSIGPGNLATSAVTNPKLANGAVCEHEARQRRRYEREAPGGRGRQPSGGTLIADTFAFAYGFYDHFGPDRLFQQLAHDLVFQVPGLAPLRKYGTIPANHKNATAALGKGAALLVYPGGDHETTAPPGTRRRSTSAIAAASSASRLRLMCRSSPWWRSAARRPLSS